MTDSTSKTMIAIPTTSLSGIKVDPAFTVPGMTIGIDLGDRHSDLCAIDASGEILEESRLPTTPQAFRQRFATMPPTRIAIEVGTHSPWIQALLSELGHEVIVANPRKLQAIYKSNRKSDRRDAEQLARFARLDPRLLSPIVHRGQATRADLQLLRSRATLVDARTQLVCHVRGSCKPFGVRLAIGPSTATFPRRVAWKIPRELRTALVPVLRTIAGLTERIRKLEHRIERISAERYPETKRLRQVNGVGAITALTFMLTLEDPTRFPKSRAVGAFFGLCPRRNQSGKSDPEMHISKAGDPELRRLLVQSAQYILGPFGTDCDLRRFGQKMAERGSKAAKRRALVAVARKLAVLLHSLWLSGQEYEPLRQIRSRDARRARKV